ncbi:MAG: putative toxin-antitoxin system toxin component, PIN family, partial [Gammaproteobacteria bacterium]
MGARTGQVIPCIVLDTNVALSALVFPSGRVAWLRQAWQSQQSVLPLVSRATAGELIAALAYPKFRLAATEQDDLLADYLPWCEAVMIPDPPPPLPVCRDPADTPFLELAVVGKAAFLVSGDKDLLALAGSFG